MKTGINGKAGSETGQPFAFYCIAPDEVEQVRSDIMEIYRTAFAGPPYERTSVDALGFGTILNRHVQREGFSLTMAQETGSGRWIGFTYGYTSRPGQWWHDLVCAALGEKLAAEWLDDCFEFAELAVDPTAQGQGIGGRLHDLLVAGLPHCTAALSTIHAPTPAYFLYQRRGWVTLREDMFFPNNRRSFRIMGLPLGSVQSIS